MMYGFLLAALWIKNEGQFMGGMEYCTILSSIACITENGVLVMPGETLKFAGEVLDIIPVEPGPIVNYFKSGSGFSLIGYRKLLLREVWRGVDVELIPVSGGLEVQFRIKPGSDPSDIRLVSDVDLNWSNVRAYQGVDEFPVEIIFREDTISFSVEGYDADHELVIDPIITVLFGSSGSKNGKDIAVDKWGNVFVAGTTEDPSTFLTPDNTYGRNGSMDVFIVKFDPALNVQAVAIIGSNSSDDPWAVEIDTTGNVIIAGQTSSPSTFSDWRYVFGSTGPFYNAAFVTKLSNNLDNHIATAILASPGGNDAANALFVTDSGDIFVAGETGDGANFSSSRRVYGTPGRLDVFVSHLSSDLSVHYGTSVLASSEFDRGYSVYVDGWGNVFVAGYAGDVAFADSVKSIFGTTGGHEAFVSRLTYNSLLLSETILLSSDNGDEARAVMVDEGGWVYVSGTTWNAPVFSGDRKFLGDVDNVETFITLLDTSLDTHYFTALIGKASTDLAYDMTMDASGNIYITGITQHVAGSNFSPRYSVFGTIAYYDAFITKFIRSGDSLLHLASTIIGSSGYDYAYGIDEDGMGNVLITGLTGDTATFSENRVYADNPDGQSAIFLLRIDNTLPVSGYERADTVISFHFDGGNLIVKNVESGYIGFDIYNTAGRLIFRKSMGFLPPGEYSIPVPVSSGTYVLLIRTGDRVFVRRVLIR